MALIRFSYFFKILRYQSTLLYLHEHVSLTIFMPSTEKFQGLDFDRLLYVVCFVFPHRSCDKTPEDRFFQMSSYSRAYVRIIYEKTKGQVPLGTLFGNQNIQAKEVYWTIPRSTRRYKMSQLIIKGFSVKRNYNKRVILSAGKRR